MKKNYNYNELVRFYNRSRKKLSSLLALGKNAYKQDILKRRIARLFELLTGMQNSLKLKGATFAAVAGFVLFQPNAANAQSFPAMQSNPFGLTASGGAWTTTTWADINNDGDKDLFAGLASGGFVYFQNTGSASVPAFAAVASNPFGLANVGAYSAPTFVDIDNDGDLDMFAGQTSGGWSYFQNTGSATSPAFAAASTNPFGLTATGSPYSIGSFADIDNDGDKDLMSGDKVGNFYYYQNTGSASSPAFAAASMNPFGLTATGFVYSTAAFVNLDGDGDLDLMSGRNDGSFSYFQNTGSASSPAFAAVVLNPFSLVATGGSGSTPAFTDLDNDGDMDLISGNSAGGFVYYANAGSVGISENAVINGLSLYPNPTTNNVTLNLNNASEVLSVEVTNILGQTISIIETVSQKNTINLPEAKGMYFVKITDTANKSNTIKVVKN